MRRVLVTSCLSVLVASTVLAAPKKAAPPTAPAAPANEEVDALALTSGARGKASIDVATAALTDGRLDVSGSFEPRKEGETIAVTYRLAEPFDLTRAEVVNSPDERDYPGISTKRLRLETAPAEDGPWTKLAETTLAKGTHAQAIPMKATPGVRWVRVTLLENHGNAEWWGLAELRVFGRRSKPRALRFTGAWETSYGEMVLTQVGQRVTGCYGGGDEAGRAGNAIVEGTLEGPIFFGTWTEYVEGERTAGGTFVFTITPENEISGVWGNAADGSDRDARWDGQPIAKASITCEKPEDRLADDLADGRAVLRGILFDTGKDVIRGESEPVLKALAAAMQADAAKRWLIEGHTDDRGGEAFNRGLSEKRAQAVRAWLVKAGVDADRLETKGFGMSRPTMPNDSEAGRAANRRVEVAAIE